MNSWIEQLWCDDWTLDPKIFAYGMTFRPPDYVKGNLALSWEMPDTSTFIAHLRQAFTGKISRRLTEGSSLLTM